MSGIFEAMQTYGLKFGPRIDELYIVYKECEQWIAGHSGKFSISNKKNTKGEAVAARLMQWIVGELDQQSPGLGTNLQGYGYKKSIAEKGGLVVSLGQGYNNERQTYVQSGKQLKPFSGSHVHGEADNAGLDFKNLTNKQFNNMGATYSASDENKTKHVVRMHFMNKIQRLQKMVSCQQDTPNTTRWFNQSGVLVTNNATVNTPIGADLDCYLYAMDRYGNLFVEVGEGAYGRSLGLKGDAKSLGLVHRGKTNHSSICAGREVICAGDIYFWKGQLIHIDNNSGHYAPTSDNLYRAVQILVDEGANVDYLRVGVRTDLYKGRTFLKNGAPDWRNQDGGDIAQNDIYRGIPGFLF